MLNDTDCLIFCAKSNTFTQDFYVLSLLTFFSLHFLVPQIKLTN